MTASFSHLGVCVSDLDTSVRFYVEGLGFELAEVFDIGSDFGKLMEVDGVELTAQYLRRDGVALELLYYRQPGHTGEAVRRPMNQLGLTHLNFRVDDVDRVAAGLVALGGTVLAETRTTFALEGGSVMDFVYCTDPDGTRIELMNLPAG